MFTQLVKLILLGFSLSLLGCNEGADRQDIRYFTHLTGIISPYFKYKPRGEISYEEAISLNHYRVLYEAQRIKAISFYKKRVKSNESYFRTHQVKYNYSGNTLERSYFNTLGDKSHMWRHYYMGGPIHIEQFQLDNSGNKLSLSMLDTIGQATETALGTTDFYWVQNGARSFIQTQFKGNGEPNLLTEYFPFYRSKITWDKLTHLHTIENVDEMDQLTMSDSAGYARVVFDFDEFGNELEWKFFDDKGQSVERKAYRQSDYGYASWKYEKYWKNRRLGLTDSISERYFDSTAQPTENNFKIHETLYRMNASGDLESIEYFGLNRVPRLHPIQDCYVMHFSYDSLGRRTGISKSSVHPNK